MFDIILINLPLNTKQKIVVYKIIHHIIYNQITSWLKHSDQLLLMIRTKSDISMSQMIKIICRTYDIIGKLDMIFITAPIRFIINNISGSTLHTIS